MKATPFGAHARWIELDFALEATLTAAEKLRDAFPEADVVVGSGGVLLDHTYAREDEIGRALAGPSTRKLTAPRSHEILVRYDGEDLDEIANATKISRDEVIRRHTGASYVVALLGFLPGFAYLEGLDPKLCLPRRASPRPRVPAGAIAIAGPYGGVYPFASPGGWHLVGSAIDFTPFDPERDPAIAFSPGDSVHFRATEAVPIVRERRVVSPNVAAPSIEVKLVPAGATVQDGGRMKLLGRGVPPSGPLDPEAHAAANVAVGNDRSAAAIEVPLGALEVVARGSARVAVDGGAAMTLEDGARLRVEPEGRAVRYLAVRGGIDVPIVLGARATLLVARFGGFQGRAIKKGDVLAIGHEPASVERAPSLDLTPRSIQVTEGPHRDRFAPGAFERFIASSWTVSALSDRVGVRLEGARIDRRDTDLGAPTPMIRGAIQVTTDGTPIVLGPDHPTTGGYPVIAVVDRASFGAFARILPRGEVRFEA